MIPYQIVSKSACISTSVKEQKGKKNKKPNNIKTKYHNYQFLWPFRYIFNNTNSYKPPITCYSIMTPKNDAICKLAPISVDHFGQTNNRISKKTFK